MEDPQVSGQYVEAVATSAGEVSPVFERKVRTFLEERGIEDVDPDGWYSRDQFAEALHEFEAEVGAKSAKQAGVKNVKITPSLSDMESLEAAVEEAKGVMRDIYKNFSPERVGQMRYERLDDGTHRIAYYGGWKYPESFTEGIFVGLTRVTTGLQTARLEATDTRPDEAHAFTVTQ